jgi:mannose-6-phosphate isomerase-like protein (cupin superfamily)
MKYIFSTEKSKRYMFPTHINELVMDRNEAAFSETFIVIIEPGKAPPLHKHDDTEQIFYIMEGRGTLLTGDTMPEESEIKPGDVVRIPVATWHTIKADRGMRIRYLTVDCFGPVQKTANLHGMHMSGFYAGNRVGIMIRSARIVIKGKSNIFLCYYLNSNIMV